MHYYLTSVEQAQEEIGKRRKQRHIIRAALDRHIEKLFGIPDYSRFIKTHLGRSIIGSTAEFADDKTYGVLARQVPGISAEDVACYLLARRLGTTPCAIAFTRDVFSSSSNDKLYRVKVPFISWSKKGKLTIECQSVVTHRTFKSYMELDMVRLDKLQAGEVALPECHRQMQGKLFGSFPEPCVWADVSSAYGEVLAMVKRAGKCPPFVWRSNGEHKDVIKSRDYTEQEARNLVVRPSSKWYYHLYLSMFLDGSMILLETYDNETGGVPEARKLFEREMDHIHSATGFLPLVVKTAPLTPEMLYVNKHLLQDPARAAEILPKMCYWPQ